MLTILLIISVVIAFILMSKRVLSQDVAMPILALLALVLAGAGESHELLENGFMEFSKIALVFTAVAIPAHILQRSNLLNWIGMLIGELIGRINIKTRINKIFIISAFCMIMVFVMAALFHNTTSILVSSIIIYIICKSYKIKAIPILAGALVASNLGGFSTRWGDTPNIIEASTWGLNHLDFVTEILPINLISLMILIVIVFIWSTLSENKSQNGTSLKIDTTFAMVDFKRSRRDISLDGRLMIIGVLGLSIAILAPLIAMKYELIFSCIAIIISVVLDYKDHRSKTIMALGTETYTTLVSIFILAQVLAYSSIGIGDRVAEWLIHSEMSIWAIASTAYIGTLFTEAASWASVAAPIIHSQTTSHVSAWALGAGIFAGSSSLITAASAGIILTQETKNNPIDSRIDFSSYIIFGLPFSLLMLVFYILVLTAFY